MGEFKDYGYNSVIPSHIINNVTEKVIRFLSPTQNMCTIHIGCGTGWLTKLIHDRGYKIFGTDASESGIQKANKI